MARCMATIVGTGNILRMASRFSGADQAMLINYWYVVLKRRDRQRHRSHTHGHGIAQQAPQD